MLSAWSASEGPAAVLPAMVPDASVRVVVANADGARFFELAPDGSLRVCEFLRSGGRPMPVEPAMHGLLAASFDVVRMQARFQAEGFARDLCGHLAAICRACEAARIYLLAEGSFLQLMRAHMDAFTHAQVVREIEGDYLGRSAEFIRQLLPRSL